MTKRKAPDQLAKRPTGYLKQIDQHQFRARELCKSSTYDKLMAEAKKEFEAFIVRKKAVSFDARNRNFSSEQPG